jgi:hypothetical protein
VVAVDWSYLPDQVRQANRINATDGSHENAIATYKVHHDSSG